MSRHTHSAIALALLALSATAACSPTCTPGADTPAAPADGNPFGMNAPTVGDQTDAYDGRFTVSQDGRDFTIVTTQIRPGETYQEARDRPFFEAQRSSRAFERGIVVPSYYSAFFIGIPEQTHNPLGGNAVPYGIEIDGKVVPFADLGGMEAAGFTMEQAEYIEEAAYRHTTLLNEGDDTMGSYFRTYRTPVELRDNPVDAADMLQRAVDRTNELLADRFTGTPAVEGAQCPVAQGMTSNGFGDITVTSDPEPREPGKPFPLVPVIATVLGVAAAAAVIRRLTKQNKFEVLHADTTEDEEVIVLRDANLSENDANAYVVFERKLLKAPEATSGVKKTKEAKRPRKWLFGGDKYEITDTQGASQAPVARTVVKKFEHDWIITTGNKKLWDKIRPNIEARNETEGELSLVDQHLRAHIRNATKRFGGEKRGKIVGNLIQPQIMLKTRMAEGLETAASHQPDRPETETLLNIAKTLRSGYSLPVEAPAAK